jgi:hypothetical protein
MFCSYCIQYLFGIQSAVFAQLFPQSTHVSGRKSPSYIICVALELKLLTTLLLGFNNIWDKNVEQLCTSMSQDSSIMPFLETLDLSYNEITDLGAGYISALFRRRDVKKSKFLRQLGMRSNKIQNLGVCLLALETSCDTLVDFRGILSDDISAAWLLSAIKSGRNVGRCKFDRDDVLSTKLSAGGQVSNDLLLGLECDHSLLQFYTQCQEWEQLTKAACADLTTQAEAAIELLIKGKVVSPFDGGANEL